jgi:hypothetical protein
MRYLCGDVVGDRSPSTFFVNERLRNNADGIAIPAFLSWYWNRLWYYSKRNITKGQAKEVSRILAVLSFSKCLLLDSRKARIKAMNSYVQRVSSPNGKVPLEFNMLDSDPIYKSMLEFLKTYGMAFSAGERIRFDRRCYSMKCLVGKKPYRPMVPPAYSVPNWKTLSVLGGDVKVDEPNDLVDAVQRYYYTKKPYDAKLTIIAESGGKYRGICPYESPYAHTTNLYYKASRCLHRLPGNCNYNQSRGHSVAKFLSSNYKTQKVLWMHRTLLIKLVLCIWLIWPKLLVLPVQFTIVLGCAS